MITNVNRIETKFILLQTYYVRFGIQGVSGGKVNILGSGSMDYSE
jgi:hypothetical protein